MNRLHEECKPLTSNPNQLAVNAVLKHLSQALSKLFSNQIRAKPFWKNSNEPATMELRTNRD